MPGKKRKYNVRFPPSRIKKIMQKDPEVGRMAMSVPVIISRALEMFLVSLLSKTCLITESKLSGTVSVNHMRQCIESERLFHFLKDMVEGATATAAQKDNQGMSMWPLYRNKMLDAPVRKPPEPEETVPQRSHNPRENDSSSSESEQLYICL
ncbi:dr1-associated corepressor [Cololabis saira]|uniref:dr1-associated corepressor n=1 Tax=Cololabis saira TaxID=129043 RepID=UPI002AD2C2FE|nr:dr1-associated corepressor [Cololabis saira]